MGILDTISSVGNFLRANTLAIPVPISLVNRALAKVVDGDPTIRAVTATTNEGWFDVCVRVRKSVLCVTAHSSFSIVSFEITKARQVIEIKPLGKPIALGEGWFSRMLIALFRGVFDKLLRQDILKLALQGKPGITFESDIIVVDLGAMGVKTAMLDAIQAQAVAHAGSLAPLARVGAEGLIDRVEIVGAHCTAQSLVLDARLAGATD